MTAILKFRGEEYKIEIDESEPDCQKFMERVEKATGVLVKNQKILTRYRKEILPKSTYADVKLKNGALLMLSGDNGDQTVKIEPKAIQEQEEKTKAEIEEENRNKEIVIGMADLGNTCYLNATIQTLRLIPEFTDIVSRFDSKDISPFVYELSLVLRFFMHENNNGFIPVTPSRFITVLRGLYPAFADMDERQMFRQQDALEFMYVIFEELNSASKKYPEFSNLLDMFTTKYIKITQQGENTISTEEASAILCPCAVNEHTITVEQGLFYPEDVDENTKTYSKITKLPKYLFIAINRTNFRKDSKTAVKITRKIKHPHVLGTALLSLCEPEYRKKVVAEKEAKERAYEYDLVSVLTHQGPSAVEGHYITHSKVNGTWYRYDNKKVTEMELDEVDKLTGSPDWHSSFVVVYKMAE